MSTGATPALKKTFPLDPAVLGSGSAATLELGGSTDADVDLAVATNQPFPTRPGGIIDLAHISLTASGGNPVAFQGGGVSLGFEFSAGVTAGAGIFDDPNQAIAALNLGETPGLDLSVGSASPAVRYALLRTGYQASGSVSGTHPIGMLGSFTFGAKGSASGLSAVLHRFAASTGADTVLEQTVQSWKLPRHINSADQLAPATWIVAEADGSVAVNLGASLGYNFNFVRQAKAFGLSGDIGMKIDAAATASFGFDVSGRYLVVVGRESDSDTDQKLRLRLFKLSSNGMQFGLNLNVGVTGVETLTPDSVDDFVKAVFGVHGVQIVNVLGQIEKWTDPSKSVGQLVAGLVNDEALTLLKNVTGIDPATAFDDARNKLLQAIKLYQSLPDRASSELLGILNKLDAPATTDFQNALNLLASNDPGTQKQALLNLLNSANIGGSPIGLLLNSLADHGLLALLDRLPQVRSAANTVLSILNGGVIAKLQQFINDKLDLNKVINVVQQTDFNRLDSFLVGRLSAFFDKTLGFADLNEVKNTINMVISKRQEIYDKAKTALNSRYGLEVAATWESTSASTAVIDAVFDFSDGKAQALFRQVVQGTSSGLDQLFTTALPSVHLNFAVLSHELTRKSTLEISLPKFNFQTQSVTTALANVHPEDDAGRVLLYDATGTNTVSVRNKFSSSLTVTVAAAVAAAGSAASFPDLRVHSTDGNTWSYQLLYVKANLMREELEAISRPFIMQYMAGEFSGGTSLSIWYNQLEDTSENILHNGPEVYGDTCASFEVTMPGDTLGAWVRKLNNAQAVAQQVSVAIQQSLKENLPLFYLNDISKLKNLGSSAPLLTWASIPPAVSFDGSEFSTTAGKDVFWDHVDKTLRAEAATSADTAVNLRLRLPELRLRLQEAGLNDTVQFYQDNQVPQILASATNTSGDILLEGLLLFESNVVFKAKAAINDVQKFLTNASTAPSQAVDRLAQFAADIATAFNQLIGQSVFADLASFRAVAQVVFAEASRTLSTGLVTRPNAMLTLDILNPAPPRTFQLSDFLNGNLPSSQDIAVAQRLVSA
jgi:hypothetical protein